MPFRLINFNIKSIFRLKIYYFLATANNNCFSTMEGENHISERDDVVIRFSGDSGDGMQMTRQAVYRYGSSDGQRHFDLSRLSGRDTRAAGDRFRSLGISGAYRRSSGLYPGRLLRRTGRDESGRPEGQRPLAEARGRRSSATATRSTTAASSGQVSGRSIR